MYDDGNGSGDADDGDNGYDAGHEVDLNGSDAAVVHVSQTWSTRVALVMIRNPPYAVLMTIH